MINSVEQHGSKVPEVGEPRLPTEVWFGGGAIGWLRGESHRDEHQSRRM